MSHYEELGCDQENLRDRCGCSLSPTLSHASVPSLSCRSQVEYHSPEGLPGPRPSREPRAITSQPVFIFTQNVKDSFERGLCLYTVETHSNGSHLPCLVNMEGSLKRIELTTKRWPLVSSLRSLACVSWIRTVRYPKAERV